MKQGVMEDTNLEQLEEKYGPELTKEIKGRIASAKENGYKQFKTEVVRESELFTEIIFATQDYAWFYEIQHSSKMIIRECLIGNYAAKKALDVMNSFVA